MSIIFIYFTKPIILYMKFRADNVYFGSYSIRRLLNFYANYGLEV